MEMEKSIKENAWMMKFETHERICNEDEVLSSINVSVLRKSRLFNVDSLRQCHFQVSQTYVILLRSSCLIIFPLTLLTFEFLRLIFL